MAATSANSDRQLLSVAPMMDWTDVHYRQMARLISKHTWLYTEMVVDQTIIHNPNTDRFLWFPPEQRPIVCQLGGSDPAKLAEAAKIVARYGYDEINLNCGCPSDRVAGAGCFGASLMLQPDTVAECCSAMRQAVDSTITVKCRLGVDNVDSYEALCNFISVVSKGSGVSHFIMHARKCLLKGLSPHENRTIPPLRYEWVFALKRDFPHLEFSLNGGLDSCQQAAAALQHSVDGASIHGVMIGRSAYNHPWACLADADVAVFGAAENAAKSRREVLAKYVEYADAVVGRYGVKPDGSRMPNVRTVARPLLNLFVGEPSGRKWRHLLDVALLKKPATISEVVQEVIKCVPEHVLDAPPKPRAQPAFATAQLPPPICSLADGPASAEWARRGEVSAGGNYGKDCCTSGSAPSMQAAAAGQNGGAAEISANGVAGLDDTEWQPGGDQQYSPVTVLQSAGIGGENEERSEKRLKSERVMVGA
ncbi:g11030 [Coccomyxa elongata]